MKSMYNNYKNAAEALNNVDAAQAKALEAQALKASNEAITAQTLEEFTASEEKFAALSAKVNVLRPAKESYEFADQIRLFADAQAARAEYVMNSQRKEDALSNKQDADIASTKATKKTEAAKTAAADAFDRPRLKSATENKAFRKVFAAPYNACSALSSACSRLWASIKNPKATAQYCGNKIWENKAPLACGVAAVAILACGYKNQTAVIKGLEVASKQLCNQASKGLSFVAKVAAQGASVLAR